MTRTRSRAPLIPPFPAIRWRGGKWQAAPKICEFVDAIPHETYVEPFAGGASVLLHKRPSDFEILNDLDGEVYNFWRVVRDKSDNKRLRESIKATPWSERELMEAQLNKALTTARDPVERARRFMVRAHMARGNTSEKSGFRTQTGWRGWRMHKPRQFHNVDHLAVVRERVQDVQLLHRDGIKIIQQWGRPLDETRVLFYVDPPYVQESRAKSRRLYKHETPDAFHRKLIAALRACPSMVLLSGYENRLYAKLLPDWRCEKFAAYAEGAKAATECLWINPAADAALGQLSLFTEAL